MTDAREQLHELISQTAAISTWSAEKTLDALLSDEGRRLMERLIWAADAATQARDADLIARVVAYLKERGVLVPPDPESLADWKREQVVIRLPGGES